MEFFVRLFFAFSQVPCPHGCEEPDEDEEMADDEERLEERYVVWGRHLPSVDDVAGPSDPNEASTKVGKDIAALFISSFDLYLT